MINISIFSYQNQNYISLCKQILQDHSFHMISSSAEFLHAKNNDREITIKGDIPCQIAFFAPSYPTINPEEIRCECAVLYGDEPFSEKLFLDCKQIITYGFSSKNTITLSSDNETSFLLAIQRNFETIEDKMIEPQEISFPKISPDLSALLGCYASFIAADIIEME